MRKIIYTRPDNGISVVSIPVDTDEVLAAAISRIGVEATNIQVVDGSIIQQDRTFRNGWVQSGASIIHDMSICRAIWRDRMRFARAPKLAQLDMQYLRADEQGDILEKQRIASQKQELRDVTSHPDINASATPEDLKLVWPAILE